VFAGALKEDDELPAVAHQRDDRPNLKEKHQRESAEIINLAIQRNIYQVATFTEAIDRDETNPFAWGNRGIAHLNRKDYRPALDDLNKALSLDPTKLFVLNARSFAYLRLGRPNDALIDAENVIDKLGEPPEPALRLLLGIAFTQKGTAHRTLGHLEQSLDALEKGIELFTEIANTTRRVHATIHKCMTLGELNRHEEALDAYEKIIEQFDGTSSPDLRILRVTAQVNINNSLRGLGRHELALKGFDKIIDQFSGSSEPKLREAVSRSLLAKADLLEQLGRYELALATNTQLVDQFSGDPELRQSQAAAMGLVCCGNNLVRLGRYEASLEIYAKAINQFSESTDSQLRDVLRTALNNKASALIELGRYDLALDTIEKLGNEAAKAQEYELRGVMALGLTNKGRALEKLGRYELAVTVFQQVIDQFGKATSQRERDEVDTSRDLKGVSLEKLAHRELGLGHFNHAMDYYRQAIQSRQESKISAKTDIEAYIQRYYSIGQQKENPSNGHGVPTRVISEKKLREIIRNEAALLTERLSQPKDRPFSILPEAEVKAIVAHGKKNPWKGRTDHGWPYHTNAFKFLHITYNRWINRGLTREILAQADPSLNTHVTRKISLEGLPPWLDLPTGSEAKLRSIADPAERTKLEVVREFFRGQKRGTRPVASRPRGRPKSKKPTPI
jgi:tetratricopeptide (TPR) repeat protein